MVGPQDRLRGSVSWLHVDWAAAALLFAVIEAQVWLTAPAGERWSTALGGAIFSLPVATRRRWPIAGVAVILTAWTVHALLTDHRGALHNTVGVLPALLLVLYGMGAYAPARRAYPAFAAAILVTSIDSLLTPGSNLLVSGVLIVGLPFAAGRLIRGRLRNAGRERDHAGLVEAQQHRDARRATERERAQIGRELHDAIAHGLSVMVIQAGAARLVMDTDVARAEVALASVEEAGRHALSEMRRLVGELQTDGVPYSLAPQPGLGEINQLLAHARSAGVSTDLRVDGPPLPLPAGLDLCAYRIVQEALTNTIKHAAPAHADINVCWHPSHLELTISDDGGGAGTPTLPDGGHGLLGMRERVSLYGGSLLAEAAPAGGFTVFARLPIPAESP
jgi:signal transduction histidine kinase